MKNIWGKKLTIIGAGIIIFAGIMLYFFDKTPPMSSLVPEDLSKSVSEPADSSHSENKR